MNRILLIMAILTYTFSSKVADTLQIRANANICGELPADLSGQKAEGVAGAFSGIIGNHLFVGGGANFPGKKPWEGGIKQFHDQLLVFKIEDDSLLLEDKDYKLPEQVAYGASITLPGGILCVGGNDSEKCFSKVFMIKENQEHKPDFQSMPDLPVPLSFASATAINNVVYIIGGSSSVDGTDSGNHFFQLDLSKSGTSEFGWQSLPAFPGKGRIYTVAVAQSNGERACVYIFGGRNVNSSKEITVFTDGLVYDPVEKTWSPVIAADSADFTVMAGTAFAEGSNHIVFAGGVPGTLVEKEQNITKKLAESVKRNDAAGIADYQRLKLKYFTEHPGFLRDILLFDTETKQLTRIGTFETHCPVTTNLVKYRNEAFITSGEIKPGVRSPYIYKVSLEKTDIDK
ncbi:kelch repeat-containing protein [Maribellus sediminis]|uniref:Kelch repeat-containing protein n=1 Tax=Maribellus sediminis TaxID=2696285 RepID=UPI0014321C15|nr:kelch repeat-containing protein [Maribellus sediminis]